MRHGVACPFHRLILVMAVGRRNPKSCLRWEKGSKCDAVLTEEVGQRDLVPAGGAVLAPKHASAQIDGGDCARASPPDMGEIDHVGGILVQAPALTAER